MLNIIEGSASAGGDREAGADVCARAEGERALLQPKHLVSELAKIMAQTFRATSTSRRICRRNLWTVMGDATQLHQVLLNLCGECARRDGRAGGTLTVAAENLDMTTTSRA